MEEGRKYLKKGQVLVFFLVFLALCGLVMVTVGIDIFRISQTKIMLQTAVDGRALHLISLYAKQMNFLADMNRQMIEPAEDTYSNRCSVDDFDMLFGNIYSGGKWETANTFRPYDTPDDGRWTYNYITHTEGYTGAAATEHTCSYQAFKYLNPKYESISTPAIWDKPPEINKFDPDQFAVSDEAFPSEARMEEYRDTFIKPRVDLQDKVISKVRRLIRHLDSEKLEFGDKGKSKVNPTVTFDADFQKYQTAYWTTHRKRVNLPYIAWEYNTASWTHTYTSGSITGCTCTVNKYWWEVYKTEAYNKNPKETIDGWLYFDDTEQKGGLKVEGERDVTGLNFGTTGREKDLPAEASVELDSTTGELWPDPDSSYKIKFK